MHTVDQRVVSVPKRFGSVSEFLFGIGKKKSKKKIIAIFMLVGHLGKYNIIIN